MLRCISKKIFLSIFIVYCFIETRAQADFSIPDTVCVGEQVNIINTSGSANTFSWNICPYNSAASPTGTNLGNLASFSNPLRNAFVFDGTDYFVFVTNHGSGTVSRLHFGNSPLNIPVAVNLGNFGGIIPPNTEGIQIRKENGLWYAIAGGGATAAVARIIRLEFGNSLLNTPTAIDLGNIGSLAYPCTIFMFQENNNWHALIANASNNSITRLDFGNSITNTPTGINFGNVGNLTYPTSIYPINENGVWYAFMTSVNSHSLTRLYFGNSLLNTPTGTNLGNIGTLHYPFDITFVRDCENLFGLIVNHSGNSTNHITRVDFTGGLGGTATGTSLGNFGAFSRPEGFSEFLRVGGSLYGFITSGGTNSITRIEVPACSGGAPYSTLQNPPPVSFDSGGVYQISLVTDETLPTQSAKCKNIVVTSQLTGLNIISNSPLCIGETLQLESNNIPDATYSWEGPNNFFSTERTPAIQNVTLLNQGIYSVTVNSNTCATASANTQVDITSFTNDVVDTTICSGKTYFVAGNFQTESGIYRDTTYSGGCNTVTTNLFFTPVPEHDTTIIICKGDSVILNDKVLKLSGSYYDTLKTSLDCDSVLVLDLITETCNNNIFIPNSFTPNQDGKNDYFFVYGRFQKFKLTIFDRWGEKIFGTENINELWDGTFKGKPVNEGVFVYVLNGIDINNEEIKLKGSVTLIRRH